MRDGSGERAPRLEEEWRVEMPDHSKRTIFVEPGNRGDESYLLEQLRSMSTRFPSIMGPLMIEWYPAVHR